ncbi:MAG: hypothetical protein Q4B05_03665 [Candidatus Saccharibacteria bacterium]|nr:hypothetical protein [Candidatus Saccharibacteria bacterium]
MNQFTQLLTPLTMLLSLTTACGVFLHDTNVDKALVSAVSSAHADSGPANETAEAARLRPGSTPHTHAEEPSLAKVVKEGRHNPRSTPRGNDRRHAHQKRTAHGNSDIDGHRLLID